MIIEKLHFDGYRSMAGMNWSSLKHYDRSPAHYREAINNPMTQTPAMLLGSALHCIALEGPAVFSDCYAVAPDGIDKRTKAGKEQWAEFVGKSAGKEVLTAEQSELVAKMWQTILAHPTAGKLLSLCQKREISLSWDNEATATPCKARIDAYDPTNGLIIDLKTTDDASLGAFARTCAKYQYHGQAAFYLDGLLSAGGNATQFIFIVVEKTAPYAVAVYLADDGMIEAGRLLVSTYLARHTECLEQETWPGYPVEVQPLSLPPWA